MKLPWLLPATCRVVQKSLVFWHLNKRRTLGTVAHWARMLKCGDVASLVSSCFHTQMEQLKWCCPWFPVNVYNAHTPAHLFVWHHKARHKTNNNYIKDRNEWRLIVEQQLCTWTDRSLWRCVAAPRGAVGMSAPSLLSPPTQDTGVANNIITNLDSVSCELRGWNSSRENPQNRFDYCICVCLPHLYTCLMVLLPRGKQGARAVGEKAEVHLWTTESFPPRSSFMLVALAWRHVNRALRGLCLAVGGGHVASYSPTLCSASWGRRPNNFFWSGNNPQEQDSLSHYIMAVLRNNV